ncbi:DUF7331 family protein [Halosolutus halophilus]|uniref:DUF7331 family protein n=1 Tax=Halosolutus halophilus TaxID=1552990 RepID=UPI00223507EC|nr:hypothetical protein [Halosolutus halophilus]
MTDQLSTPDQQPAVQSARFDQYVSYEDDGGTVICDRSNPAAWIRSTELVPCRR